ncbi:hypothetical protein CHS0354_034725 [Potamilus streckersoni]|uniref:Solute carrier family 13 member 5 n=1 Tax=Potamilus streckersoni TaxID=2493646 RepID=A0AAE0SIR1_9BIVA|nr:hypothetical protein CHS0354_034725 [Potamilus streckersoni]
MGISDTSIMRFLRDLWDIKEILIVVLTPIIMLPLPVLLPHSEAICAYAVIIMAVYWLTEALPIAVTSLLPIFLFPVLGLMTAKDVSAKYINDTSTMFIGGLIMAAAIEHWNIHKRIALKILMYVGSEPRWLLLGLMVPTWFLSMWINNTATTAMMIPIANAVLVQIKNTEDDIKEVEGVDNPALDMKDTNLKTLSGSCETTLNGDSHINLYEKCRDVQDVEVKNVEEEEAKEMRQDPHYMGLCKALSLCIAYSANIGGTASLTGTAPNLVFRGQIDIVYQKHGLDSPITFGNWMAYCVPTSFILLVILWIWLQIHFLRCKGCCSCQKGNKAKGIVKEIIQEEYRKLGPINFAQAAVMVHFVVLVVLWITRDLGGVSGWGNYFKKKYTSDCVPAILISIMMFVVPTKIPRVFCSRGLDRQERTKPLLQWSVVHEKLPWGVFLLLGGGFAMASAAETSKLSAWIGDKMSVFNGFEPWVMNLIICSIVAAATEVTSNTATCTLMMPILAKLAGNLNVNPMYLMFPGAIATSFAFMLPVATPPNAVVFSYGYLRVIDMVSAGFMMNVFCVLVLVLTTETIGNAVYNFKELPVGFLAHTTSAVNILTNTTANIMNTTSS